MAVLTFKEDKLALAVLIHGIYLGWQTPPEHVDEHGITWHHCIVPHPPKPMILVEKEQTECKIKHGLI